MERFITLGNSHLKILKMVAQTDNITLLTVSIVIVIPDLELRPVVAMII